MSGTTTKSRLFGAHEQGAFRDLLINFNKAVDDFGGGVPLNINTTAVGNVGAGEDDLMTYALAASKLATVGAGVRVRLWGTTANNATAKTLKVYFGAAAALSLALTISQAGRWMVELTVIKTGASTQDVSVLLHECTAALAAAKAAHVITTGTETDTAAITIKATGTGGADNDLVQEGMIVTYIPVASDLTAAKIGDDNGTAITS